MKDKKKKKKKKTRTIFLRFVLLLVSLLSSRWALQGLIERNLFGNKDLSVVDLFAIVEMGVTRFDRETFVWKRRFVCRRSLCYRRDGRYKV